ncbi:serine/threonine-protein kinase 31-like isoform X2 [Ruditapes philippinarum]|uniref:serine/threonine-protein kinase 31-like isoform X2 n=1 Tax=Ruditapes philippinarum TaxID=129788 RepID=UPI00295BEAEF|nr:serine/threonine-protein kinase 31-like isoform X2 [Ruditapes philippinarum]
MARKGLQTFNVFVGNLPTDANERNVGKMFTPYGEISGIIVKETTKVQPPYNKYAFVKFFCEPDAEKAVLELDKTNVQGSQIVVKRAEDRKDKKKPFGEGGGRRECGVSQTDWICIVPECRNSNFAWRLTCNKCNAPKPEIPTSNDTVETGSNRSGPTFPSMGAAVEQDNQGQREAVMITFVENPISLWVQIVSDENTQKIFSITEQLAQLCPIAQHVSGQPDLGKIYGCCFAEDGMWYRCQVKQFLGTDKYKIQYIDYGNTEEVSSSSLVELAPSVASVKGLAFKVQLNNTRAKDLSDKLGKQFLKALTDNQMGQLVRTRALADGSGYYGHLYIDNISVGDSMISAGYCTTRPTMGKTPRQQNETGMFPEPPGPQLMGPPPYAAGMKPQRDRNTVSPLGQPPPLMGLPMMGMPPVGQQHMPNMGYPPMQMAQQDLARDKKLQSKLTKKNQENEKLRTEKDAANMQAEYMRSKVKTLQEEFAASAAKLREDTISKRINTVVALSAVVRHLREQFPTSKSTCLLEEAMALCTECERVDNSKCKSLGEVSTSLARYKAAQDEIKKCKEQGELQDLIGTRDECRKGLHKSLCVCLEEMENLPLETRYKQVQETQLRLMNTYSEYLKIQVQDVPSLENVAPGFISWKTKKDTEFKDVRTATDFCEGALQTALNQVKQLISVETNPEIEKSDVDIDDLFKTYSHALQREVNVTDLVHGKDSNLIAIVIASVRKELNQEAATLENIATLHREFNTRKLSIEPWLDKPPTFSHVQENRKQVKSLRSKLRHLQADKQDLEESGDEEELAGVKKEEDKIRAQLQDALVQSDSLSTEVATLAESNFPELILQYPDLGIDSYLLYKGLVKANRDIDYYSLKPGFRPGIYTSVFSGQPVLLQEFHIEDTEQFMKQLVSYNGDSNQIQAVFFSKSDRLAYVQTAWDGGHLLDKAMKMKKLSAEEAHNVCVSLAEQLVQIHARDCIHGEITPQAVIMREDNSVTLMYPDFSKSPGERVSKRYAAEGGFVFQTPELQYTSPEVLGNAADVYNLVLLIFWLICPNHEAPSLSNGSLDTKQFSPTMQQLFDGVLSGKAAKRVHAKQVFQMLQEAKPTEVCQQEPVPVSKPAQTAPAPVMSTPVIKSTNEPMEIGVFRAEDYMTETNILPVQPEPVYNAGADTDNSWTTESLSATSSSRGGSPLDNTVLETAKSDIPESVSNHTIDGTDFQEEISGNMDDTGSEGVAEVTKSEGNTKVSGSGDITDVTLSGGVTEVKESEETTNKTESEEVVEVTQSEVTPSERAIEVTPSGGTTEVTPSGGTTEVTPSGGTTEVTPTEGVSDVSGSEEIAEITEKGAACEKTVADNSLKMLLLKQEDIPHINGPSRSQSPLSNLLNMMIKKSTKSD